MLDVKVTTNFPGEPILRQTPGGKGLWDDCKFVVNDLTQDSCDIWVVLNGLQHAERALCRAGRAILITMEPPEAKTYAPDFLKQFDLVITCHPAVRHKNVVHTFQGLPWHIGLDRGPRGAHGEDGFRCRFDYDAFAHMPIPEKHGLISVICSSDDSLPGHRARLDFLNRLQQAFGDRIQVFGRGILPVADKFDAIAPFKYHLAWENSVTPHYWSEKLGDTFLGFAYPIYWGCPNILDYFSSDSLTKIDILQPDRAIAIIEHVINENRFDQHLNALLGARKLVLHDYNTFEVIRQACILLQTSPARWITLKPDYLCGRWKPRSVALRFQNKLNRLLANNN
jgi:hypothetical protein